MYTKNIEDQQLYHCWKHEFLIRKLLYSLKDISINFTKLILRSEAKRRLNFILSKQQQFIIILQFDNFVKCCFSSDDQPYMAKKPLKWPLLINDAKDQTLQAIS